jgi:hypothetical protein
LGGLVGSLWGSPRLGALFGGVHGWLAGRRRIYEWRHRGGVVAFVLDHTWALPTTIGGTVAMIASRGRQRLTGSDPGFDEPLSRRRNRFVFRRGFVLRRGFALTVGTVVTGAADANGEVTERRRRLVDDHEDVHVWQARLLGPFYPMLYAAWFGSGAVFALVRRARGRTSGSLDDDLDIFAYYRNPFEWHAYTCDHNWPPAGVDRDAVWKKECPVREWIPRPLRGSAGSPTAPR